MARINKNMLVREASGNFAKQFVYRKRGNDTFIVRMPTFNPNQVPSAEQLEIRELFAMAATYAKGAISDPELKKQYQKKAKPGRSAYNIAFRDYTKPPVVQNINTARYTGAIGTRIVVTAKDDFKVAEVWVSIYSASDILIEEGAAVLNPINNNQWIYTATTNNPSLNGGIVRAVAKDLPGNEGVLEFGL